MADNEYEIEQLVLQRGEGLFVNIDDKRRLELVTSLAKSFDPNISKDAIEEIFNDMENLEPITKLLTDDNIEDIMINNTKNIFVFDSRSGYVNTGLSIKDVEDLATFVAKLRLYATNKAANGNIMDVHLPTKNRVNIVSSPQGYDITIRNFRSTPLSIIDLINRRELDYRIAARLWLYVDGFKIRPANILIGGIPGSGKTTLLNACLSFFRTDSRIITIEETYELDTSTMPNSVNLETSIDVPMELLVENALRMRPDTVVIGEVRGKEANDMIAAMAVGKRGMASIHASSTRDIVDRLTHAPMNVPKDIISVIDVLIVVGTVYDRRVATRKVVQISEISGMETKVLLSDLYRYDYKTHLPSEILSSVTYRDLVAGMMGVPATDIIEEERVRATILERLNKIGKRDMASLSETIRDYYDNPEATLKRIGLPTLAPVVTV